MLTDRGQKFWSDMGHFPIDLNVPPTEDWMAGFDRSAFQGENLLQQDELQALLDKAQCEFHR